MMQQVYVYVGGAQTGGAEVTPHGTAVLSLTIDVPLCGFCNLTVVTNIFKTATKVTL